jgi:hypothetical protein
MAAARFGVERGRTARSLRRMVDSKGHDASSPAEMPPPAWKDIAALTYKRVRDGNVGLVAAGVARTQAAPKVAKEKG